MLRKKELNRYYKNFVENIEKYLISGFSMSVNIYPVDGPGAIFEFNLNKENNRRTIYQKVSKKLNIALGRIEQNLIKGDLSNVKFGGTNLIIENERIIVIKGDDNQNQWSNRALPLNYLKQESRLKSIEDKLNTSSWERHFNQKPFIVISTISVLMLSAFWSVYTWQVDKHEKNIKSEVNKTKSEYELKIKWLKENHLSVLSAQEKECMYDLKISKNTQNCNQTTINNKKGLTNK